MGSETETDADLAGLREALAQLQREGTVAADALEATAQRIRAGLTPDAWPAEAERVSRWQAGREAIAQSTQAAGGRWRDGAGYEGLAVELDRLYAEREELRQGIGKLRAQEATLKEMLATADDPEISESLLQALDKIEKRVAALTPDVPTGPGHVPTQAGAPDGRRDAGSPPGAEAPDPAPRGATPSAVPTEEPEADHGEGGNVGDGAPVPRGTALPQGGDPAQAGDPAQPGGPGEGKAAPARDITPGIPGVSGAESRTSPSEAAVSVRDSPAPGARTAPDPQSYAVPSVPLAQEEGDASEPAEEPPASLPWPAAMTAIDWEPGAPWSTGTPPPVARLITEGRTAAAYWMTLVSNERPVRARAAAFLAAAFSCAEDGDATRIQIDHDLTQQELADDPEAHLVAVCAALRAGLTARWAHVLISGFSMPPGLPEPWQELLAPLAETVQMGHTFQPSAIEDPADTPTQLTSGELRESARVLLEDLPRRKIKYQRASRVLQYLTGPSGEVHHALRSVADWTEGDSEAASFSAYAARLHRTEYVDRLIDEADSRFRTPKQAREAIHSGALRQLHTTIGSVAELLAKAEAVSAALRNGPGADTELPEFAPALAALGDQPAPAGVGGAALSLLRSWLTGRHLGTGAPATRKVPDDCLLHLPALPRHPDGGLDRDDPRAPRALAALVAPATDEEALSRYLDQGDLHLARALVRLVENRAEDTRPTADWLEQAVRRCREAEKIWRRRTAEQHRNAAGLLAQIRTLNLIPADDERELTGRLQEFADGDEAGRYQYAMRELSSLVDDLTGRVTRYTDKLRADLDDLRLDPDRPLAEGDHDRILRLIEEGDTVTAEEFLALAGSGQQLPDRPDDENAELRAFLAGITGPGVPRPGGEGVHAGWWADRYGSGSPLTPNAQTALDSWRALCTKKGRNSNWQQHIPRVLRLLGLEPASFAAERMGQGVRRFKGRATVTEGAGYVAALGSRATTYTVLLVWEEQRADGPLAHLGDADVDANIILYLHPLAHEGRAALAEASRRSAQQALVVDPAVFGWMAVRAPGAFRALQQVTLPWASYNPYTPFVAGLVPPEVFYGRDDEMQQVMDPAGGLFLYGGRQLGKSALLRRVAELFPSRSESNVAVYIDLLKAEIGQAESPERIWNLLAEDLKRRHVLDAKTSDQAGIAVVPKRIRDWLDEDRSRRLLILADEADAFLTADSRRVFRSGGESTFQNVKRFQQLMEQTDRRLKVVFAGLHQVQRFGELSNVSTAHGGPDVLVGPLNPRAAVRLVTEPMAALGFTFDRPELVWRILAITNYQANLVQIFCSELVRTLHARPQPGSERPSRISEEDVQAVAASETVRRRLAERLRFTINLEDRYRVLTLVIALRSLADGYRGAYTAEELLRWAADAWPEGFERLGVKQVQIHLTEMVGLGLLLRLGDRPSRFAVRSPNVVNMLGTREELELELREAEFSNPYEYDPRAARRLLGRDPGSDPSRYITRYSPLTEGQLEEAARSGVTFIGTTRLQRPQLVVKATTAFAEGRGVTVHRLTPGEDLRTSLAKASRGHTNRVVVADLRDATSAALHDVARAALDHAGPAADPHSRTTGRKQQNNRSVVVVGDAAAVGAFRDGPGEGLPVRFQAPERWTVESLRAWPECPFVSRAERGRLIRITGGWAPWVELAIAEVSVNGATLDSALERVGQVIGQSDNLSRHLEFSGLDAQDLTRLARWVPYVDEGEGVSVDDVATAAELELDATVQWLARLEHLGVLDAVAQGIAPDPVTYRAVRAWTPPEDR